MNDSTRRPDRVTLGIALMVGFTICAPMIDTFANLSSGYGVVAQIVAARWPNPTLYWLLLGVGVASTIAHLFVSFALSMAPAEIIIASGIGIYARERAIERRLLLNQPAD